MGTGAARVMDERALTFLKKYGKKYEVIDAKELGIDAVSYTHLDVYKRQSFTSSSKRSVVTAYIPSYKASCSIFSVSR